MNIQHSQEIQHIRHAKDYRNDAPSFIRNRSARDRFAVIATSGAVAAVIAAASMVPASASRPSEDGPGPARAVTHASNTKSNTDDGVSTPCFAVRPPAQWGSDAGTQPRCTHTYGVDDSFGFIVRKPHGAPVSVTVDHINSMYAAQVSEADAAPTPFVTADRSERMVAAQASEAEAAPTPFITADRAEHQFAVDSEKSATATVMSADRAEHQFAVESEKSADTSDQASGRHWDTCFYTYRSYRSWEAAQIGMPRCDIHGGVSP